MSRPTVLVPGYWARPGCKARRRLSVTDTRCSSSSTSATGGLSRRLAFAGGLAPPDCPEVVTLVVKMLQ